MLAASLPWSLLNVHLTVTLHTCVQDNISPAILKKIKPYVENPNMAIDVVTKVSKAASGLCMFVHAMDVYSKASTNHNPCGSPWVLHRTENSRFAAVAACSTYL